MHIGIHVRPTVDGVDIREVSRMIEAAGFDALYLPEHIHIPVGVRGPSGTSPEWLEWCKRVLDPFTALAAVASVTERLPLGAGVCLLPQHDPRSCWRCGRSGRWMSRRSRGVRQVRPALAVAQASSAAAPAHRCRW